MKDTKEILHADGAEITLLTRAGQDYISLTDIARYRVADYPSIAIQNWMRSRNVIRFLGLWERLHNPDFNSIEFDGIDRESGLNSFILTPKKWVERTAAIGIATRQGRYAATYAHSDIALEFASWISPEFKLYIIQDYQRLKAEESQKLSLEWNLSRAISKINYRIHTDAIKSILLPELTSRQCGMTYASEADVLNVALFGKTAKEWRAEHPATHGNLRDEASLVQLITLSNMESLNAEFIRQGLPQPERLVRLHESARQMLRSLADLPAIQQLEG